MNKLKITDDQYNIWVSSDWHFLHKNISGPERSLWKDGYRDFKDEYVMTDSIINSINDMVGENDTIIFLGDFCFKDHNKIPELRSRIVCKNIHFVLGNHDNNILKYKDYFTSVNDKLEVEYFGKHFICDHYAHRVWLGSHRGYYHLYAHSHDSLDKHPNQPWGRSMDVGIDSAYRLKYSYRPFNLDEIIDILDKRDTKIVDHHLPTTNIK